MDNDEKIKEYEAHKTLVPSYEQWQAKLEENKRLKHDVGNLGYKIKNQRKEIERQIAQNAQLKEELSRESYKVSEAYCFVEELKELLKECESSIQYYQETYGAMDLDTYTLLAKLKEALK